MKETMPESIADMPEYKALIRKRYKVAIPLSVVILLAYVSFILLVAYAPDILSIRMADGISTLGIWYGLGLIILTLLVTGLYVLYANSQLEDLIHTIHEKRGIHE